jgi:ABC-type transport system involved in multi-copper enzyme maturation permease subunit
MNLLNSFRAEWILLNRRRLWIGLGLTAVVFTITATWLLLGSAEPVATRGDGPGVSVEALTGSGGATAAVISSVGFATVLVVAAFAAAMGNEITRGTLRAALTRQPSRMSLITGKLAARVVLAAILMAVALVMGALTSALVAPSLDVDTDGWFTSAALGDGFADYGRLLVFVTMYALIGTTVALLVKSTPIALGICLLWFGPVENVLGEGRDWAQRWFPGLVMRSLVQPESPDALSLETTLVTLSIYAVVCAGVIALVMSRRDVTAG